MSKKSNILHRLLQRTSVIYSFYPILKLAPHCSFRLLPYFEFVMSLPHLQRQMCFSVKQCQYIRTLILHIPDILLNSFYIIYIVPS